jgi:LAS superfamily LD-carboxypeptidase LdcB
MVTAKDEPELRDYLTGRFVPEKHPDFVKVKKPYAAYEGMVMHKEAYSAVTKMIDSARKDNVKLFIISATRNFSYQKKIWENKWNHQHSYSGSDLAKKTNDPIEKAKIILKFSSMPGTSRHHWGTDIDFNNLNDSYFQKGQGKKAYAWLVKNASQYGFAQPYIALGENRKTGYYEEKWHWSYTPLSKGFLKDYISTVSYGDINGFSGFETARNVKIIENFVQGINPECK